MATNTITKKKNGNSEFDISALVAYDRNNIKTNTYAAPDTHYVWIVGLSFSENKIYINEICFSGSDKDKKAVENYLKMFDKLIAFRNGIGAHEVAANIQDHLDSGLSMEDAYLAVISTATFEE